MRVFVGIDLGSTTTKAVVLDEEERVVGRGITNSRSNYDVACAVVREEALVATRFALVERFANGGGGALVELARNFRLQQHLELNERLREAMLMLAAKRDVPASVINDICDAMASRTRSGAPRKSDFFRDIAAADYMTLAAEVKGVGFDKLCAIFDSAILAVENVTLEGAFERHIIPALAETEKGFGPLRNAVDRARAVDIEEVLTIGTGYGRQRLPFPKEQIRSEILCHGLGAHAMFPGTRTVLDIGGQDTKAIQVDGGGIVTSFQMNDRCAAGCGRYLGYIADEMNLGLHELGPLADESRQRVKINSTCTVFAGAELRDRLALGQKREDILAGLHRAIILRAMSLLARSGGVSDEFTFTGGVARNSAAVRALRDLISENYGERTLNISPESIYTGALGAAIFARRAAA